MREQDLRVLRDTMKTLEEMQAYLDATRVTLRLMLCEGHEVNYEPCAKEVAAYNAERVIYGDFTRSPSTVPSKGVNR